MAGRRGHAVMTAAAMPPAAVTAVADDDPFAVDLPPRPYPGLRPFEAAEWPIFFGRERMVDAVVSQLIGGQLLVVHGDSGSGKSSLIRAGVLPRLRQEGARAGLRWRTVSVMPRGGPLLNLARALAALDGRGDDAERVLALRRALNQGRLAPTALAGLLLADETDHLCLLIDQFEELFEHARLQGGSEARLLTDALVALAEQPPPRLHVVLTMRSEYLGACARFPGLAEAVNAHQYLLPPMSVPDLLRAIREPARLYGGDVEPALAERLAADAAGVDGLPLVQHALMLLQREHGAPATWRLTLAHYPADGLAAQLSRHADAVREQADAATPQRPRLVEDLFRALTTINAEGHAVRRPQPLGRLVEVLQADLPTLALAIDLFRADGVSFLVPRDARPLVENDWVDISHEALIRGWHALADSTDGWLVNEFRNGLVWRALLVQAESYEREPDSVLSPTTTDERTRWLQRRSPAWAERYGGGWERVQALIAASRARHAADARRNSQQRIIKWGAAGVSLVLLAMYGVQRTVSNQVAGERDAAKVQAQRAESLLSSTEAGTRQLQSALADLRRQARSPGSRATLEAAVIAATAQFADVVDQLDNAAQKAAAGAEPTAAARVARPLVYIQYANSAQEPGVRAFRQLLQDARVDGVALNAPGYELRPTSTARSVLRCFRTAECRDDAPKVLAVVQQALARPRLEIENVSATYENAKGVRPRQYEVWFAPGDEIVPAAAPKQ